MKAVPLDIEYRYRDFIYLVSDKIGNLYLIPHFRFRRTVYFKKLIPFKNGNGKAIKYHGVNISFKQLRKKAYQSKETIIVY